MPPKGPYAKGVAKREEVLAAALDLFSRDGYDKVSFREIARTTGLSQAGLLHYFASKEELFIEVLRRRDLRNQQRYGAEHGPQLTAEGLIEAVRRNHDEPELVRLFVALSAESTIPGSGAQSFFEERYAGITTAIAEDIHQRQITGDLPEHLDPDSVASVLVAAADGLQLQWLLAPDRVDMGERLSSLWQGLRGRRS